MERSAGSEPAPAPPEAPARKVPARRPTTLLPGGLRPRPDLPPSQRAVLMVKGQEQMVSATEAAQAGYTIVSLREDWTPFIFLNHRGTDGQLKTNRYRSIFLGLASDTTDDDGQPLRRAPRRAKATRRAAKSRSTPTPQSHNYLELYGIPPTVGVIRKRFLEDAPDEAGQHRCAAVDFEKIRAVTSIPVRDVKAQRKHDARLGALTRQVEAKRRQAGAATLEALAEKSPPLARDVKRVLRYQLNRAAFAEVEKRLACEGLLSPKSRHHQGTFDYPMRKAIIRFQHKHKVYDAPSLRRRTVEALGRTPLENDQEALVRVLTERVVAAAQILEDGSVDRLGPRPPKGEPRTRIPPTYRSASGRTLPVRNLVAEAQEALLKQLGLETPAASLAFFRRHSADDFQWLQAAIKLPQPPEYYSRDMSLSVVIDRGDVFYDPPFTADGKRRGQGRSRFPSFVLQVHYRDQTIPLVRWRTTIGGWRTELASNGYEYYRYKGSDVGPRVWKHIVAAPVWIAPESTPIRSLVKYKRVNGHSQLVANYDEVGPGYLSAYGLVAAYNVSPGRDGRPDWDNGIRVHGSSSYRSIYSQSGYSHGCHRLTNHLAIRLFAFVLEHRPFTVAGDLPLGLNRPFLYKDNLVVLRLPTRGYRFVLDAPIPVMVLKGNIRGTRQRPVDGFIPKPGVRYPAGPMPSTSGKPEDRAGGGQGEEADDEATRGTGRDKAGASGGGATPRAAGARSPAPPPQPASAGGAP